MYFNGHAPIWSMVLLGRLVESHTIFTFRSANVYEELACQSIIVNKPDNTISCSCNIFTKRCYCHMSLYQASHMILKMETSKQYNVFCTIFIHCCLLYGMCSSVYTRKGSGLPIVVNTWAFTEATDAGELRLYL